MSTARPWLSEKKWAENSISSGAGRGHLLLWGFAVFWNLVTLPVFLNFPDIWMKIQRAPATGFVFLFPLVGAGLIFGAIAMTRQWRRFGPTPLVLDPFPGSLGGHVGGSIETNIPFEAAQKTAVSLSCIESYVSGSGKNRSRREAVKWQSDGICHAERLAGGTALKFRFDVPAELPVSDVERGSRYHLWRVTIHAELAGADFDRHFDVPVFKTGEVSAAIGEGTESNQATVDAAVAGVESVAEIRSAPGGIEARFPALQRPLQGITMVIFGLVFAGAGVGAGYGGASVIFPLVFILVGSFILLYGVYYLGKSLLILVTPEGIKTRRFLFGYPVFTKRMAAADFSSFEIKQAGTLKSGRKTTVFYRLYARGAAGQEIPVAERLAGRSEAQLLLETFSTYLGKA